MPVWPAEFQRMQHYRHAAFCTTAKQPIISYESVAGTPDDACYPEPNELKILELNGGPTFGRKTRSTKQAAQADEVTLRIERPIRSTLLSPRLAFGRTCGGGPRGPRPRRGRESRRRPLSRHGARRPDPGMVERTAAEIKERGLRNADIRQMDAEDLEFPDASFDCVLCGFGLFFLPHLP